MKVITSKMISALLTIVMLMNIALPVAALTVETTVPSENEDGEVLVIPEGDEQPETEAAEPVEDETVEEVLDETTETKDEDTEETVPEAADETVVDETENSSNRAPEGYVPRVTDEVSYTAAPVELEEDLPKVLLIQDVLPWDSDANRKILSGITEYQVTTTKDFLNVNLEEYGVVVFANDQPFNTYENYKEFKEYLELFASLGGVIVFGACDAGWSGGNLNELLPGDVSKKTHYVYHNYVVDNSHLIVTGALTDNVHLMDEELYSNYCSHVSFDEETLPAGTKIILRESDTNRPTLVEYPLGEGRVIASGLTWEHNYTHGSSYGYGDFAKVALEDMYRYAIRVSDIDVDELHMLEDWRVQKEAHAIVVADGESGMENLAPLANAKVDIDGKEYITDENGIVLTNDYGLKMVSVTADGYRDRKEYYDLEKQGSRIFLMEKDRNDGLPYSTFCTSAKNGQQPYIDLRYQALHFTEGTGSMMIMWLDGNWNGHGEGEFHIIQEATKDAPGKTIKVPAGNYLNIAPGKTFAPNSQIKMQMVAKDGTKSEMIDLNIEIDKAPVEGGPTENTALKEGVTKMDWLGNYPIKSDNEVFTKLLTTDMSFFSELIPVEIVKEHNEDGTITYKGLIGFVTGEGSKNLLNNKSNEKDFKMESAWDELKKQVKGYQKAGNLKEYWNKLDKKYGKQLHGTKLRASVDTEVKVCGFLEVTVNLNNEVIKSDGGIIVNGAAHAVIGKTYMAGPVPLYFEFRPGVEAEASGGITFYNEENGLTIKPFFNGVDLALPSISLEGGVGVRGVATTGLKGTGKLVVGLPGTDDPNVNVDLKLDASIHCKVLFVVDYNKSFASTKIHFYPKDKAISEAAMALDDGGSEFTLTSRDYLDNETEWNNVPTPLAANAEWVAETLQGGVMPDAMPQLYQIGDKQIMLFLRDLGERATGNHTQLVYSVNNWGTWSEPQPVWESETADFFFNAAADGDRLVVAWQKSSVQAAANDAESLLAEVAGSSEICYAVWDNDSEMFVEQQFITDNAVVDMMPAAAINGDHTVISWVSNDANNVLGETGNYSIYQAVINQYGDLKTTVLHSTDEYIVELAAGMSNGSNAVMYSALNAEGTVTLYALNNGAVAQIPASPNAAGLSFEDGMFLWQEDGSICTLTPGEQSADVLIPAGVADVSSSYEYVKGNGTHSVLWAESGEEGYVIKVSVLCGDTWSAPVDLLYGPDDAVTFMDAILLSSGEYSMAMNTASYVDGELDWTTLQYANVAPEGNVSLELAEVEYPDWDNETQEISIAIENKGTLPIYKANLTIDSYGENLLSEVVAMTLLPGESMMITKTLDIQNVTEEMDCVVGVWAENDMDQSDNEMNITLGKTDVSLKLDAYEQDDQFLFVLTASNHSNVDANAALSIMEDSLDGVVLNMKNIGVVSSDENVQYLYSIDRSKIDFAGEDSKVYFFSLSALENDWNEYDNICTYMIKAPNDAVVDPDGEMEVIEIVEPESVEIVEKQLHFNSLDVAGVQLHAMVYPENAAAAVSWSAANNDIVHITEDGVVTPLKAGTTTITAMVTEDIKDTITVTVMVEASETAKGDINDNGKINTGDAILILRYAAGEDILSQLGISEAEFFERADINGNGKVNTGDAILILRYAAGEEIEYF